MNAEELWLYIVCVKSAYYYFVESHILKAVQKMYHCASLHLVKPLLLVGVVGLKRAFQSDCFLFACNQLKFQKQGGWPAVSEI